jgi:pimeloyl-ACP methyl ester carboxylesterase
MVRSSSDPDRARGDAAAARDTVVLVHSSTGSARQWKALVARLAPDHDVHAVDLHGHGARRVWAGRGPLTLDDEVALIEPIVRAARRVHVVGHSYGGAVALQVATRFPAAVASVAVYEPVLFLLLFDDDPDGVPAREAVAIADTVHKYLARGDAYRAAARFLDYWCGAGTWDALSVARRDAAAQRMRSVLSHFDALFGAGLSPFALRGVRAPMLMMSGADTVASTRRIAALLRQGLPRARHDVLPGMGHMGPVTHAELVNDRVVAFLRQQARPPAAARRVA